MVCNRKFLAFIGPVDYSVSLYHPPEMYLSYFRENNVRIVIRLNKRMYDGNVFSSAGIVHYDLFFPDGSCPPRHILFKFLQISEDSSGALAVHCKAGLGRTGSLIGCYLIKHYRMTAHEAIGWMRICRPGSVIGHQQAWLEQFEPWLIKQGNLYRKRTFQDTEKLPIHEYGLYSIAEKAVKQKPVIFGKAPSPPPPIQRQTRSETAPPIRPQAARIREEKNENEDEEIFITACDLTTKPTTSMTQMKGCIIKNNTISEEYDPNDPCLAERDVPFWKKYFCCQVCVERFNDSMWMMAVRFARVTPNSCLSSILCTFCDMVAPSKKAEKEQYEWSVRSVKPNTPKISKRGDPGNTTGVLRRGTGAGEPRPPPRGSPSSSSNSARCHMQRDKDKNNDFKCENVKNIVYPPIPTFRTTQGPMIKTLNDARKFLIRSSLYNDNRAKNLNASVTVTPQYSLQTPNSYPYNQATGNNMGRVAPSYNSVPRGPTQPQQRRRLGRSPSPSPSHSPTRFVDMSRATNTPPATQPAVSKLFSKDSRSALKDALSRLRLSMPRDGSIGKRSVGAASLGARRDAPSDNRAPSVRSDERPLATQGDMLNSIKFQRRYRDTLNADKISTMLHDKVNLQRERNSGGTSKNFFSPTRPSSPIPRRKQHT